MYQIRYLWVHPICYFVNVEFSVSYNVEGLTIVKLRIIKIQLILHTSVSHNDRYRSSRIVTVTVAEFDVVCNNNTTPFVLLLLFSIIICYEISSMHGVLINYHINK